VVRASRFASAFTFQYSKRPGTPAADMSDQIPHEIVQERYVRLLGVVEETAWAENRNLIGSSVEVLVANGEGRKDGSTDRVSGRARDHRLVHVAIDQSLGVPRPGDFVTAEITHAAPHHLVADRIFGVRRTRAGDQSVVAESSADTGVSLGMPTIRV